MAQALGITVTAWSPLAGGMLSGKYRITENGVQSQDGKSRLDNPDMQQFMQNRERTNRVPDGLSKVAAETELAPAQVALAWLLRRSVPIIPTIGARKIEQLKTNLHIADIRLSDSQIRLLDEVSQIELGFPHDFLDKAMVQSFTFGGMRDRIYH
jgi:aryl-alcohol dehydrogenase-like predicted oxidoreductase